MEFTNILILILVIIISTLPLYFSVKLLGGKTSLIKTFLVMVIVSFGSTLISLILPFGIILGWLFLIWVFHEIFRLKYFNAFIAWILWIIFIVIFSFIGMLIGIGTLIFI